MIRNTSQSVKKSSGHSLLSAMFIRGLSAVLFVVTAFVQAEPQELSAKHPPITITQACEPRYVTGQANWEQPLTATNHYDFALADKRLAIPDCSNFVIDPMNRLPLDTAPASLAVDVRCPDKNWQRRIRGRRQVENTADEIGAQPTVQIFTLTRAVKKGDGLTSNDFTTESAPATVHRKTRSLGCRTHSTTQHVICCRGAF